MRGLTQRALAAVLNYRNPISLGFQRLTRRPIVTVTDRTTGLTFRCRRHADRMLGETFHQRIYDVPFVPVREHDVVVDVGANHGFVSAYFARRGAQVFAFEPSPEVFRFLEQNMAANRLTGRVTARPYAIGDHDGTTSFFETDRLGGGMSSIEPQFVSGLNIAIQQTHTVACRTLQSACDELGIARIRLLKLDCEGAELRILKSLDRTFLTRVDAIALEYHLGAYDLRTLVDLVLGWEDFHVSKVAGHGVENANLNIVSARCVREWAGPVVDVSTDRV